MHFDLSRYKSGPIFHTEIFATLWLSLWFAFIYRLRVRSVTHAVRECEAEYAKFPAFYPCQTFSGGKIFTAQE